MKTSLFIGIGIAASLSTVTHAQSVSTEQVVVTGQRLEETLPQQLAQYGTKVDTIPDEQILNGGYLDVASSLQTLAPGLYVSPKNGPFDYANVSLQGSRTQDVLWLIDGVRINNRLYGGTSPLDTLPAGMVERIEVLDGGQALFYGTEAAAGAINIVTKSFAAQPDGAVSVGVDTNGGRHVDAYFRDTLGKNQFVLYGSGDKSSGFQPFRDQDYQPSSTDRKRAYDEFTLGAKYAYEFSDGLRFSTLYQHTGGKLDDALPQLSAQAFNDRDENLVSSKLDYSPSDRLQFYLKGYGHWWYSHYTEFDHELDGSGAVVPGVLDDIEDHGFWGYRDYGANAMAKLALNRDFDYLLGYDFQKYSGNDAVLVITEKSEQVNAVFTQLRTTDLFSKAHFSVGLRYNDPSVGQAATVWNAGGQVDLNSHLYVRANGGTAFRLPTAEELFANDPDDERGDPNLKPEQSRNLNASIGGSVGEGAPALGWEAVAFFRDISNLIAADGFDASTDQSLFENVPGNVTVRGFELDLKATFAASLSGNLSFTDSRARQPGSDTQVVGIPVQQYKALLDYHPGNLPLGASVTLNHVGDVYASLWDGTEKYGDYTVIDLAGRVYLDNERHQTINVAVENLFDKQYATSLGNAQRDADGSNYMYWNLGVPRTLSVRYSYKF